MASLPLRALAVVALAAASSAVAQPVLIDDFEDGDLSTMFVFAGAEPGVLSTITNTPDGSAFALRFEVDADQYGGFTGFGQPVQGGPVDVTGFQNPVLEFDFSANGSFTFEINFQNTGGGGEGEIRNALRLTGDNGTWRRYALPLASFFPTNAATFEYDDVFQYVFTVVDAVGDSNPATAETELVLDNIRVVEGQSFSNALTAFNFDDGDFSSFFFFAGGEGIAASATTSTPDGSANAFHGEIDGDEYNGFAGFGSTIAGAPINLTGQESLNFFLRTNGSAVMEVNLQTNAPAGGNEGRERIRVSDTGGAYRQVSIPLSAFIQSSATAPDFTQVYNVVLTFVDVPGDANPGTTEFQFDIDAIGFGEQLPPVASEPAPELAARPVLFPNPTAGTATLRLDLAAPTALRVDVTDVLGRVVATLADGAAPAGPVQMSVPELGTGVYFVRVRTATGVTTAPLSVVR